MRSSNSFCLDYRALRKYKCVSTLQGCLHFRPAWMGGTRLSKYSLHTVLVKGAGLHSQSFKTGRVNKSIIRTHAHTHLYVSLSLLWTIVGSFQLLWAGECRVAAFSHCFLLGRISKISRFTLHVRKGKQTSPTLSGDCLRKAVPAPCQ